MLQKITFKNLFFYLVFLLVISDCIYHLVKKQLLYLPSQDFLILQELNQTKYNSITLGLEPYRGIMLAANFLNKVNLHSIKDSYFPKIDFRPSLITPENPLLITEDSYLRSAAVDFTKLSNKLILVSRFDQSDKIFVSNKGQIIIASVSGAYNRESDGHNWWYWVERKVDFTVQPQFIPGNIIQTKVNFEYATHGPQRLTLNIIKKDGSIRKILFSGKDGALVLFDMIIDVSPLELARISIETDGKGSTLGNGDSRVAAFMCRNLSINPVSPANKFN